MRQNVINKIEPADATHKVYLIIVQYYSEWSNFREVDCLCGCRRFDITLGEQHQSNICAVAVYIVVQDVRLNPISSVKILRLVVSDTEIQKIQRLVVNAYTFHYLRGYILSFLAVWCVQFVFFQNVCNGWLSESRIISYRCLFCSCQFFVFAIRLAVARS